MGLMTNITKTFSAVGSVGSIVAEGADMISSSFCEGKNRLVNEISSSNDEARLENATSYILAKADAIKKIMAALNISATEATQLLDTELNR